MGRKSSGVLNDTWTTLGCVAASVVTMGQTVVYAAVEGIRHAGEDGYESTVGGGLAGIGMLVAPLLFGVLAVVHACLLILPVETCARFAARRFGGPVWGWAVPPLTVLGLLYAAFNIYVFPVLGIVPLAPVSPDIDVEQPAPLLPLAGWIAATGVVPLLGVAYFRRRDLRRPVTAKTLVGRVAAATVCACVPLVVWMAALPGYEPPKLGRAAYAGDWSEPDGLGVLRLGADGRATAVRLPYEAMFAADASDEPDTSGVKHCAGTGTWTFQPEATAADPGGPHRDQVEVQVEGCSGPVVWQITGTAGQPELFSSLGDPDAGVTVFLRKQGGASGAQSPR
jgi:hypothetical protein